MKILRLYIIWLFMEVCCCNIRKIFNLVFFRLIIWWFMDGVICMLKLLYFFGISGLLCVGIVIDKI